MAEDNAKWLKLAADSFHSSTSFIDNYQRTLWENNIRMFNSQHVTGSKYNSELYSKRSRIFRPKTRSSGMKFEAAVVTAFFSTADVVNVTPEQPNDILQRVSASLANNLMNLRLTRTTPWFVVLLGAAQEAWKMGNVCSYQHWEYEKDKNGKVIKDKPSIQLRPLENIRIDESAEWYDPVGTSPYLIDMIPMYVQDVKAKMKAKKGKVDPEWFPLEDMEIAEASKNQIDRIRIAREKGTFDPLTQTKAVRDHDIVWVHRNIVREGGIDYVFYTLAEFYMLSNPVPLEDVYPQGRPYVIGTVMNEPFRVYKSGMPELGKGIQEEINSVANDRLDNVHLVINKRYFAKRGKNIDFRSLLRNIAGSVTVMDNPQEDVEVVTTPDITSSAYAEQDRLNVDYDELIGNFSAGSVQTSRSLGDTVGGMNLASSGAGQITEYLLRMFIETWVEPVLRQYLKVLQKFESTEVIMQCAMNDQEVQQFIRPGQNVDYDKLLDQNLLLDVNVGLTATNPQMKVEKLMFALSSLGQVLSGPMGQYGDVPEISKEIFGALGYKDGARFIKGLLQGQDPMVLQLQQQVQQLTQALEGKQAEAQAKYAAENERVKLDWAKLELDKQWKTVEAQEVMAKAQKESADAKKTIVEMNRLLSGIEDSLKLAEMNINREGQHLDYDSKLRQDKTARDKIVADLKKMREEINGKLKITLANAHLGGKPSKPSLASVASQNPPPPEPPKGVSNDILFAANGFWNDGNTSPPDTIVTSENGQTEGVIPKGRPDQMMMTHEPTAFDGQDVQAVIPEGQMMPSHGPQVELDKLRQELHSGQTPTIKPDKAKQTITNWTPDMFEVTINEGAAVKNNNPGNLRPVGKVKGFKKYGSPEEGYVALIKDIQAKKMGNTRTGLNPDSSLSDLIAVYAPAIENDPKKYTKFLADNLPGVSPDTPIKYIDEEALAAAIANYESGTTVKRK